MHAMQIHNAKTLTDVQTQLQPHIIITFYRITQSRVRVLHTATADAQSDAAKRYSQMQRQASWLGLEQPPPRNDEKWTNVSVHFSVTKKS